MDSNQEKAKLGAEAINAFLAQFEPHDIYSKIVLEVLFEELYGINSDDNKELNGTSKRHNQIVAVSRPPR